MIDVFCKDFKEFVINHKKVSNDLKILESSETDKINRIVECMKSALESKKEAFKVEVIRFEMFNQKQVIELLQLINFEILRGIEFYSSHFEDVIDYLVKWNLCCRLDVNFRCNDLSAENLKSVKRMLNYPSVFRRISLEYKKSNGFEKEHVIAFFEPFKPKFLNCCIKLDLKNSSVAQAARLSLQEALSLKVLANPLLMGIIAEKIHYFDIQHLREVCRDIHTCIDTIKPDPYISAYEIETRFLVQTGKTTTSFDKDFYDRVKRSKHELLVTLLTMRNKLAFSRRFENRIHFFKNGRGGETYSASQFKISTLHQKSRMDYLSLEKIGNLFDLIGDVLKSRETPLRVKTLILDEANESDIMKILPYLDSVESIVNLFLSELRPLNLAEVSKLIQWRNALKLDMKNCTIGNSIQELNIINFKAVDIKIKNLSTDDVILLKENIPKSSEFKKFEIKFDDSSIDDNLYTSMPPYHRVPNNRSVWFFPMLISNYFLHILLYEQKKLLILKRADRDSVPEDFLAEVSKLVQWRNALELEVTNSIVLNSVEELNIINYQKIDIKIAILSTNDVIYLKENILKSVKFNKFEIKFENSSIDDSLYTSMPPYHRVPNNRSIWFFPMPNSNDFLHILLYEQKNRITYKRVDRDSVPEDFLELKLNEFED